MARERRRRKRGERVAALTTVLSRFNVSARLAFAASLRDDMREERTFAPKSARRDSDSTSRVLQAALDALDDNNEDFKKLNDWLAHWPVEDQQAFRAFKYTEPISEHFNGACTPPPEPPLRAIVPIEERAREAITGPSPLVLRGIDSIRDADIERSLKEHSTAWCITKFSGVDRFSFSQAIYTLMPSKRTLAWCSGREDVISGYDYCPPETDAEINRHLRLERLVERDPARAFRKFFGTDKPWGDRRRTRYKPKPA